MDSEFDIKKIASISPIIVGALVFFGVFKLDVYYSYYGINIVDYIGLEETLISFLDDINIAILCLLLMIIHTTVGTALFVKLATWAINKNNPKQYEVSSDAIAKGSVNKIRKPIGITITILITLIGYFSLFLFQKVWIIYLTMLFSFQVIFLLLDLLNKWLFKVEEDKMIKPSIVVLLFLFTYTLAQLDIVKTETNPSVVHLTTNDNEHIDTINSLVFLGKTSEYIILRDKHNSQNEYIKRENVIEYIEFKPIHGTLGERFDFIVSGFNTYHTCE